MDYKYPMHAAPLTTMLKTKTYQVAKVVSIQVPKSPKCRKLCPNRKFCLTTTTKSIGFQQRKHLQM